MNEDLKNWTLAYLKNKDMITKKIVKIDEDAKNSLLNVQYKDKPIKHYILEKLDDKIFAHINTNDFKTIVCLNVEENFHFLTKNWKKLSDMKNLSIIFVNMKTHDKWLINPHVHSMIADPESIEQGLRTMFDTANGKIVDMPKKKKKPSMFEESSNQDEEESEE